MTAKQVAKKAESLGLKVLSYTEGNEIEDGAVQLEKNYHIQVGSEGSYLLLVEEKGSGDDICFSYINTFSNKQVWEAAVKLIK